MTGAVVLEALREGPKTTGELAAAAGVSRNAALCSLYHLERTGFQIVNERPRGGRVEGLYRITYDREIPDAERRCEWWSCTTRLSSYNSAHYCRRHRDQLAALFLHGLGAALDRMTEAPGYEQLELEAVVP